MDRDPQDVRALNEPRQSAPKATRSDRFGIRLAVELVLVCSICLGSYLLGERYEWRGWQFVVPFVTAGGFALVIGVSMNAVHGFVASAVLATVSIVAFGLGLDAGHSLDDPAIRQGFTTWVLFSVVIVPVAWLIGTAIRHVRHFRAAGPSGP